VGPVRSCLCVGATSLGLSSEYDLQRFAVDGLTAEHALESLGLLHGE